MSKPTYYVQECPTCGRTLEIRVEYLGKRVVCQHCRGALLAEDPSNRRTPATCWSLLRRADRLLELAAQQRPATQ